MFSPNGEKYRVYYIVNTIIPSEGSIDSFYVDTPRNEDVIEEIIATRPHLEIYRNSIKIVNYEPIKG